jgi:branched-chain amino acid transport system substrate-binding protein
MKYFSVVAAGVLLSSLFPAIAGAGNTIKVGIVDSYTGPAAPLANDVLDGFRLAVATINAGGGVLGKRVEWVTRDDRSRPAVALNLTRELIERERVDIILGTSDGASYLAVSGLCQKERVPFFATGYTRRTYGTGPDNKGLRYTFHVSETAEMAGRAAAVGLSTRNYTTYWIAGDDSEYGHALTESLWGNLKRLKPGVRFIGQTWWKEGEKEYGRCISDIARAKPDCIIFASPSGIVDFQKATATRLPAFALYQPRAIDQSCLTTQGQAALEGVMGTSGYLFSFPETARNRAFVDDFRRAFHRYPGAGAFYGYLTARFISEAYLKSAVADKERFIDALEGLVVDTPSGSVEMSAAEHQALLPVFFGTSHRDSRYPDFLVAADIITVTPGDYGLTRLPSYAQAVPPAPLEAPARRPMADQGMEQAAGDSDKPIRRTPAQTVDVAAIPSFGKEQRLFGEKDVAIVIGIENYRKNLPKSNYSSNDARTMKAYLEALGFAPRNIEYLSDEDATRSDIQKAIEGWLPNRATKESRVFIYY